MNQDSSWAVVFGGPSPEYEISILTGLQAERLLAGAGESVTPLYWSPTGEWFQVPAGTEAGDYLEGPPRGSRAVEVRLGAEPGFYVPRRFGADRLRLDAALNCLHGGLGEGGGLAALFAMLGVPQTGSSLYAGALGMDKLAFGALVRDAGVPALPREALVPGVAPTFDGPYIVKPRFGGSSIGISVVDDAAAAHALGRTDPQLRAGAVVEPFRRDLVDLNIAFRTAPTLALSAIERPLRGDGGVYSYADKYLQGPRDGQAGLSVAARELPAQVPDAVAEQIRRHAERVARLTGLTGIVRVDFLYDPASGEVLVNEVNSVPGALSLYLWAGSEPRVPGAMVLLDALREARDAPPAEQPVGFGSGAALRAAGGIAAKLVGLDGPRA